MTRVLALGVLLLGGCFDYDILSRYYDASIVDGAEDLGDAGLSAYAQAVLASNPIAYYRFEETSGSVAKDSSGHGLDGAYGGNVKHADGIVSGSQHAALFPGGAWDFASLVSIAHKPMLEPMNAVTVEAWISLNEIMSPGPAFVSYGGDDQPSFESYILELDTDKPFFFAGTSSPAGAISSDSLVMATTYHLVGVHTAVDNQIYVNGVLQEDKPTAGGAIVYDEMHGLSIGGTMTSDNGPRLIVPGTVDEVAIYATALSSSTIASHYNLGKPE